MGQIPIDEIGDFLKKVAPLIVAIIGIFSFKRYNKRRQYQIEERKISIRVSADLLEEIRKERDLYRAEASELRTEVSELKIQNGILLNEVKLLKTEIVELRQIILTIKNENEQ